MHGTPRVWTLSSIGHDQLANRKVFLEYYQIFPALRSDHTMPILTALQELSMVGVLPTPHHPIPHTGHTTAHHPLSAVRKAVSEGLWNQGRRSQRISTCPHGLGVPGQANPVPREDQDFLQPKSLPWAAITMRFGRKMWPPLMAYLRKPP